MYVCMHIQYLRLCLSKKKYVWMKQAYVNTFQDHVVYWCRHFSHNVHRDSRRAKIFVEIYIYIFTIYNTYFVSYVCKTYVRPTLA